MISKFSLFPQRLIEQLRQFVCQSFGSFFVLSKAWECFASIVPVSQPRQFRKAHAPHLKSNAAINFDWLLTTLIRAEFWTLIVATYAKIVKSAIVSSSPANHSDFSKNDSSELSKTLTASRRSCEIFFTPARSTGRYKNKIFITLVWKQSAICNSQQNLLSLEMNSLHRSTCANQPVRVSSSRLDKISIWRSSLGSKRSLATPSKQNLHRRKREPDATDWSSNIPACSARLCRCRWSSLPLPIPNFWLSAEPSDSAVTTRCDKKSETSQLALPRACKFKAKLSIKHLPLIVTQSRRKYFFTSVCSW